MPEIKAGDLVMVVRGRECCGGGRQGYPFIVTAIEKRKSGCNNCGTVVEGVQAFVRGNLWAEVSRLIRIDPPAQPEVIETEKEVQT